MKRRCDFKILKMELTNIDSGLSDIQGRIVCIITVGGSGNLYSSVTRVALLRLCK